MMRILVLYRELAGYFVACLNELCEQHHVNADLVAYPVHKDAPFQFSFSSRIQFLDRQQMTEDSLDQLLKNGGYNLIFCGGWADSLYLKTISKYPNTTALIGFDNQWRGSIKQWMACLYARWRFTPLFDLAFVPGAEQAKFARMMGFSQIVQGAYACDVRRFAPIYQQRNAAFWAMKKKKLFFVGRYAPEKFIQELQDVFSELQAQNFPDWTLVCAGTGPLFDNKKHSAAIIHLGFMQPEELISRMNEAHAFVLPSTFEPWGVVVHEFAAAGVPLVLSDAVGARNAFLREGQNGFVFEAGNRIALKSALQDLMSRSDQELREMSNHSYYLAAEITPQTWANSLMPYIRP
jgi:glycosyltransferase involved in cell wall biosynthesis